MGPLEKQEKRESKSRLGILSSLRERRSRGWSPVAWPSACAAHNNPKKRTKFQKCETQFIEGSCWLTVWAGKARQQRPAKLVFSSRVLTRFIFITVPAFRAIPLNEANGIIKRREVNYIKPHRAFSF
jgi:hypothetical protein